MSNEFLPFAIGGGANVESQASYSASPVVTNGFQTGLVPSNRFNKALRQASFMASCLAQYIANTLGVSTLDNGNVATMLTYLGELFGNLIGGAANEIPYQTGANTTAFITAPSVAGTALTWTGSAFAWASGVVSAILHSTDYTINYGSAVIEQYIENSTGVNTTLTITYPAAFPTHSYIPSWTVYDTSGEGPPDQVVLSVQSYSLSGCVLNVGVNGGSTSRTVTIAVTVKGY